MKLVDCRGSNDCKSLLHFILDQLLQDAPQIEALPKELLSVQPAGKLQVCRPPQCCITVTHVLYASKPCFSMSRLGMVAPFTAYGKVVGLQHATCCLTPCASGCFVLLTGANSAQRLEIRLLTYQQSLNASQARRNNLLKSYNVVYTMSDIAGTPARTRRLK